MHHATCTTRRAARADLDQVGLQRQRDHVGHVHRPRLPLRCDHQLDLQLKPMELRQVTHSGRAVSV